MHPNVRLLGLLVTLVALALQTPGCGSDARATDTCRRIENARCEQAPKCIEGFAGDVTSCQRFYEVQCGRGVPDAVKEPSSAELKKCIDAINTNCDAVRDPATFCPFLTAREEPAVADSGASPIPDMGAADAPADGG